MKIFAPAKVNLTLDITGRREDGYHLMEMVMQTVSLYDVVYLSRREAGIAFSCDAPHLPTDGRNLAVRAAEAFFARTGISGGAEVRLLKRIPSGAGMGGGSADAAAVLAGLNRLYAASLSGEALMELGLSLGADVPFCLAGGTALVQGVGERITPLPALPTCSLVVVKPRFSVNTKNAFSLFDQKTCSRHPRREAVLAAVARRDLPAIARELCNVFEETVPYRELAGIKDALLACGAMGAVMTGSGSAVFGIFPKKQDAARCTAKLRGPDRNVWLCAPVPHGPLIQPEAAPA